MMIFEKKWGKDKLINKFYKRKKLLLKVKINKTNMTSHPLQIIMHLHYLRL